MKKIVFMTVLFAAMINTGCKDTHCPAFPAQLIDYYPYRTGDVLKFSNDRNEVLTMEVNFDYTSGEESFAWNCACACEAEHTFSTEFSESTELSVEGKIYTGDNSVTLRCKFNDWNTTDTYYLQKDNINPFASENSNLFGGTVTLEDAKANRINNIVIVKGEGIIEFFDIKNNCTWKKVKE